MGVHFRSSTTTTTFWNSHLRGAQKCWELQKKKKKTTHPPLQTFCLVWYMTVIFPWISPPKLLQKNKREHPHQKWDPWQEPVPLGQGTSASNFFIRAHYLTPPGSALAKAIGFRGSIELPSMGFKWFQNTLKGVFIYRFSGLPLLVHKKRSCLQPFCCINRIFCSMIAKWLMYVCQLPSSVLPIYWFNHKIECWTFPLFFFFFWIIFAAVGKRLGCNMLTLIEKSLATNTSKNVRQM